MSNCYTRQQIYLLNQLRLLWSQHVYWTRFFIISTASDLPDLPVVTGRLLQNPKDFAGLLATFYGTCSARELQNLLTEHLKIGVDLVTASKNKEKDKAAQLKRQWYENAQEIACFLAEINPCWDKCKWETMLKSLLDMTEKEASLRLSGNYAADTEIFGDIESEAMIMADYMFYGIIQQFFC